jgi:hypothetical protein
MEVYPNRNRPATGGIDAGQSKVEERSSFLEQGTSKNHEPLKTQRKARKAEGVSGFLAFDFLCVLSASVVNRFFMGFWGFPHVDIQNDEICLLRPGWY